MSKGNILKKGRIIISLLFFISITLLFIDFREFIPSHYADSILFLQFTPSLLKFINIVSITTVGFIIVLILTLLFGRVYCSTICPLGIFQDIISFISKKIKKRKIFRYQKAKNILRYSILGVTILFFISGNIFFISLLDPYSVYGRIATDMFRPVIIGLNNIFSGFLEKASVFYLYPIDLIYFNPLTLIIPAVFLLLVLWLSFYHGRLYCNTVCPVGAFLGLLSKFSLWKIGIDETKCTQCNKCSQVCKAECIDIKNEQVNFSRCVGCFNCLNICPENAIDYQFSFSGKGHNKTTVIKENPTDNNRRKLFSGILFYLMGSTFYKIRSQQYNQRYRNRNNGNAGNGSGEGRNRKAAEMKVIDREHPISPPGSVSLENFTNNCTACHLCITACPTKVLQPSFLEYGLTGMMQPRMDYIKSFCNFDCTVCGEICPTGAILPLTKKEKHITQLGIAHFVKRNCIVHTSGTACGACSEHCPTKAVHMVPYKNGLTIPEVDESICIGCGACEYACPLDPPYKAIYVRSNTEHKKAEKPTSEDIEDKDFEGDFPF